jgi:hypothetical protein
MKRGNGVFAWIAVAVLVVGCCSAPVQNVTTVATDESKALGSASSFHFRLAAEGLPADGLWKSTAAIADINGDGFLDLVVHPRLAKGPKAFLGNGLGQWLESSEGLGMNVSCGGGLQLADFDSDGKLDLVVADHCDGVFVFLGDGKGNWRNVVKGMGTEFGQSAKTKERDEMGFKGAEAVAVGDVNGDGFLDLVISSSDQGGLTVFLGDGTGRNWREVKLSGLPNGEQPDPGDVYFGGWAFDLKLQDMNGDGNLDVVASYYTGPRVWHGDGKGRFRDSSEGLIKTRLGGIYGRIATGDLNRDGRPDIVIANNYNGAEAYLQRPDGSWQGPIDVMPELKGGAQSVAVADLDGDGNLDVVIGGAMSPEPNYEWIPFGLYVRWGNGKGEFNARPGTDLPSIGLAVIWGIAAADVNGDGRPDLVVSTGGATGRITARAGRAPGKDPVVQQFYPAPSVQVWLNEGAVRP